MARFDSALLLVSLLREMRLTGEAGFEWRLTGLTEIFVLVIAVAERRWKYGFTIELLLSSSLPTFRNEDSSAFLFSASFASSKGF